MNGEVSFTMVVRFNKPLDSVHHHINFGENVDSFYFKLKGIDDVVCIDFDTFTGYIDKEDPTLVTLEYTNIDYSCSRNLYATEIKDFAHIQSITALDMEVIGVVPIEIVESTLEFDNVELDVPLDLFTPQLLADTVIEDLNVI